MTPTRTERFAWISDLADAVMDHTATPGQRREIEAALSDSPEARAFYLDYAALRADLIWERIDRGEQAAAGVTRGPSVAGRLPWRRVAHWAGAAAVLIGAIVGYGWIIAHDGTRDKPIADADSAVVATVIDAEAVQWSSEPLTPGQEIGSGWVQMASGEMELLMHSRAMMRVSGEAEFRVDGPMGVTLRSGRAMFDCPRSAVGFTVHSPDLTVVDLGTRFTVRTTPESGSGVRVHEGRVRLGWRDAEGTAKVRELVAGQGVAYRRGTSEPVAAWSVGDEAELAEAEVLFDYPMGEADADAGDGAAVRSMRGAWGDPLSGEGGARYVSGGPEGGLAVAFDGTADAVLWRRGAGEPIPEAWVLEAWAKVSEAHADRNMMIVCQGDSAQDGMGLMVVGGRWAGLLSTRGLIDSGMAAELGRWTHLALVCDGRTTRLLVNGIETAWLDATPVATPPRSVVVTIGGNAVQPNEGFAGEIDRVRCVSLRRLSGPATSPN